MTHLQGIITISLSIAITAAIFILFRILGDTWGTKRLRNFHAYKHIENVIGIKLQFMLAKSEIIQYMLPNHFYVGWKDPPFVKKPGEVMSTSTIEFDSIRIKVTYDNTNEDPQYLKVVNKLSRMHKLYWYVTQQMGEMVSDR